MKTLYLLRHGKSSWGKPGLDDFERPLKKRGIKAARLMGRHMASSGMRPDLVLCSAAARAQQTLENFLQGFGTDLDFRIEKALYHARPRGIIDRLATVSDDTQSVMVVGHNPGLQNLALDLSEGSEDDWRRMEDKFPTAALAVLTGNENSWSPILAGSFCLQNFHTPRSLTY